MYVHSDIYICGGVVWEGFVLALDCYPKATNKEQNILTMVVMCAVMRRGIVVDGG